MLMVKEVPATSSSAAWSPKDEFFVTPASNCFFLSLLPSPLLSFFQSGDIPKLTDCMSVQIYIENSNCLTLAKLKSSKIADPNFKYEKVEE